MAFAVLSVDSPHRNINHQLGYAENPLPVGHIFQNLPEQPLAVFEHALLMTGWTKVPSLHENVSKYS
jgi:hypothetical protein